MNLCLPSLVGITNQLGAELVVVSWEPLPVRNNIVWKIHKASHKNIYDQIMVGLKHCTYDRVFLAEHDVLYPESHFDLIPTDKICYNSNTYHLNKHGFFPTEPVNFLSTLVATKSILESAVKEKLKELNTTGRVLWAEPEGPNGYDRIPGADPIIDIRHGSNLTGMRSTSIYLEELDPWGSYKQFDLW